MKEAIQRAIAILRPNLEGDRPGVDGEWPLHCPLPSHDDGKRSASLNVVKGEWYCHACGIGGKVEDLLDLIDREVDGDYKPGEQASSTFIDFGLEDFLVRSNGNGNGSNGHAPKRLDISTGTIRGWQVALFRERKALRYLTRKRGLSKEVIRQYQIGWDRDQHVFTIPVFDADGQLLNVRRYDPAPRNSRRKIWGETGFNSPTLYPMDQLEHETLIICEGEWDALVTIGKGFAAITRTGAAKVWKSSWNGLFADKIVYLCHDMDIAGQDGNRRVERALRKIAKDIRIVRLPYPLAEKHGKDLTDYWLEHSPDEFRRLLANSHSTLQSQSDAELVDIDVLESFDASQAGRALRMRVTITGKKNPTYLIPEDVAYTCDMDAGTKCLVCPLNSVKGQASLTIKSSDALILEMMQATADKVNDLLRKSIGAPKCGRLDISVTNYRAVEELYARPSVEIARTDVVRQGEYVNRKVVSVGRHDTLPNNTVEIVGTIHPNPRTQHNEFQAWQLLKTETSVDRFQMTPGLLDDMRVFQPRPKQRPLAKLRDIADDLAKHVTKIYGRPEMHAAMDLVWHSALQFEFGGALQRRGWMELLVVGDTRTGKSEAASKMVQFFGAGEMVNCEAATFAGIVGGLQQFGAGKEWEVTWGAVPLNDRRLVVLDELSGLSHDQIAQMSNIRSSGEAQLTKIRSERTWARTRLIWLGNPRNGRMADYTYGVQAILPLVGQAEDVARFDLAMSVSADEVDPQVINSDHDEFTPQNYPQDLCQAMVMWAWSRRAEHIFWQEGAQEAVYKAAVELGKRYVETPPLIQAANVRVKVARVAVALALRTFSTDDGDRVLVTKTHVQDAVDFIDHLYSMHSFGYRDWSKEKLRDLADAASNYDECREYLYENKHLAKFLRQCGGRFRRQDLEDMLMLDRETATALISKLYNWRMLAKVGPDIKLQPLLHQLLRDDLRG